MPLSEIEMKMLTDYALARSKEQEIRIFIDWHSYSQLWLAPWSYDDAVELPPESPDQASHSFSLSIGLCSMVQ